MADSGDANLLDSAFSAGGDVLYGVEGTWLWWYRYDPATGGFAPPGRHRHHARHAVRRDDGRLRTPRPRRARPAGRAGAREPAEHGRSHHIGHRQPDPDHVDHVAGAVLAAEADTDAAGNTLVRRDEYDGYVIRQYPDNVAGHWRDEKTAVWDRYWPHDPALGPDSRREVMGRQYSPDGRVFHPGVPWVPPGDIRC